MTEIKISLAIIKQQNNENFANSLQRWQDSSSNVVFYIGGANGLDRPLVKTLKTCEQCWSLASLYYRNYTITNQLPYYLGY